MGRKSGKISKKIRGGALTCRFVGVWQKGVFDMLDMSKTVLVITGCIRPNSGTFQLSLKDTDK